MFLVSVYLINRSMYLDIDQIRISSQVERSNKRNVPKDFKPLQIQIVRSISV